MLLEVKGLSKSFHNNHVLKGLNLNVEEGEVIVIIGPSGSGKRRFFAISTFLNELMRER